MDIFNPKFVRRLDPALYAANKDVNDPRLGERVLRTYDSYGEAQIVMVGFPQDEGVRRLHGRTGSAEATVEIRRALYRLSAGGLEKLRLLDLGDIALQPKMEQTHALMQQWVQQLLEDGKRVVILGGSGDVVYPAFSALAVAAPSMLAFNINSRFDARPDAIHNSATPFRQLLDESCIKPEMLYVMGYQPFFNSPVDLQYLRDQGVNTCSLQTLHDLGVTPTFKRVLRKRNLDVIGWAFDMEVVCSADAPGVAAPNPTGLSAQDFCGIAAMAGSDSRSRLLTLTDVNPVFDLDQRTSQLAAIALWHYFSAAQSA